MGRSDQRRWSWFRPRRLAGVLERVSWRTLALGTPMGLGALGIGFWAQGLMPAPSQLNGPLLALEQQIIEASTAIERWFRLAW